jgi:hypothetical protein
MNDQASLIADLQRKNAALENRIATLERRPMQATHAVPARPVEQPQKFIEAHAVVSNIAPSATTDLPTAMQLAQLRSIVMRRFPVLAPNLSSDRADEIESAYAREFEAAFIALAKMGRTTDGKLDVTKYPSFWVSVAEAVLRSERAPPTTSLTLKPFAAALLAWSDVAHSLNVPERFPFDLSFGLIEGGGKPANSESWKSVLATGKVRDPVPLPAARAWSPTDGRPMVTISGGNGAVGAGPVIG